MGKINLHNYEAFLIDYLDGTLNEASITELKAFIFANPQLKIDLNDLDLPVFAKDELKIDFKNELKKTGPLVEDETLINYLEGKLTLTEREAFECVLVNNRQLSDKLAAYKQTILSPDPFVVFLFKEQLYKTGDELILANRSLVSAEDQLSITDKLQFEKELKADVLLQKEVALFQKTKLKPDLTIVFENKEALKKETKVIALFSFTRIAAIAAAILLLFGLGLVFNYYNSKPVITKELAKKETNKTIKNNDDQAIAKPDSIITLNKITGNAALVAKKEDTFVKSSSVKKQANNPLNELKTSSVAVNQQPEKTVLDNNDKAVNTKDQVALATNPVPVDTTINNLVNINLPGYIKQNYLTTVEEDENAASAPAKKGFWQRAVQLAKRVNKLGIKAIDGEEKTPGKNYALSFNSFSVEKR